MSATLSRLLLSMTLLLATPVVYGITVMMAVEMTRYSPGQEVAAFAIATVVGLIVLIGGWLGIWRGKLRWMAKRIGQTCGVIEAGFVIGVGARVTTRLVLGNEAGGLGVFFAGIAWALNWLGGTALVWRQSAAECAERLNGFGIGTVACPTWGYNLAGDGPEPAEAGA